MSDELTIRGIQDWTAGMRRNDTPFLTSLGYKHVKVGEQDEFGRTLLGYTEVDQERKTFCEQEAAYYRAELMRVYENGKFQLVGGVDDEGDPDDRWEPIETEETRFLHNAINGYEKEADDIYPRPIWDRELTDEEKRPKTMTWGWARPALPLADIEPR